MYRDSNLMTSKLLERALIEKHVVIMSILLGQIAMLWPVVNRLLPYP